MTHIRDTLELLADRNPVVDRARTLGRKAEQIEAETLAVGRLRRQGWVPPLIQAHLGLTKGVYRDRRTRSLTPRVQDQIAREMERT